MPNPIFVGEKQSKGPVPALLSLYHGDVSVQDIDAIMAGKKALDGKMGGIAIRDALKNIDVDKAIREARSSLESKRGTKKDQLHRTLKYLLALKENGLKPHEAYIMHNLPVLPPVFRPMTPTACGDVAKSPLNDLYRNLAVNNDELKKMNPHEFGAEIGNELREKTWDSLKALQSVGDYKMGYDEGTGESRSFKGLIDMIGGGTGEQPKQGYFQEHLIKRKQDLSIRSTIVPEPTLHIDEVGIPLRAAMELYKPFVIGKMHSKYSYKPSEAMDEVHKFTDRAKLALQETMDERPLLLKRDPSLHKFNVMAFRPKVVEGKAIKIHPLVCGGFNADFDGDTMAGTIPVSQQAVEEAQKMFPSKNLFSPTTYRPMHVPNQEFLLGLNLATKWGKTVDKSFATMAALKKAHENHEVGLTDVVKLGGKPTTIGRALIAHGLPPQSAFVKAILNDPDFRIDKKVIGNIVGDISKNHPEKFDQVVNHLKDVGVDQSFKEGFSLGLKDFAPLKARDHIFAQAQKESDHARRTITNIHERDAKTVAVWDKARMQIEDAARAEYHAGGGSRLAQMVYSGARGKEEQYRQMVAAPMLVQDATGKTVAHPITRSYGEGLDLGDYWLSQHGARKGTLQRASGTREPGAMTKDIINSTISTLITSNDCKTTHGISMPLDPKSPYHGDIYDRFLSRDHGPFKAGEMVTPKVVDVLRKTLGKDAKIQVRSPLKCQHGSGVCAKCFGLNEDGLLHSVGTNIGILAGQSLGEPATQLAMDAFHSGGVASGRGGSSVSKIERLKQILKMPKTLRGSAILAKVDGNVTSIKPRPGLGGDIVTIGGVDHHIREGEINPALKVGATIRRGASLSHDTAPVHPKELLHITKDMHEVQRYLVDELYSKLYKDENVRPRNIELVVRSLTNLTRVKDPGHSHWETHDVVPHSEVEEYNREHKGQKSFKPITHEPILKGSGEIPRHSENWMARLNYQRLGETVQRAAGMSWKSDLHGTHPIPGIAYGSEFGHPPNPPAGKKPYVY
jgi:DNA-directed RNA polymerase subunit beta'